MMLMLVASFFGSFGAVLLKAGSGHVRSFHSLVMNWRLAAGVMLFLLSSVFFVLGNRAGELSVLYPMVSLGYIWTLFWSRLFFKESFTRGKFLGLGLILLGLVFLGLGNR